MNEIEEVAQRIERRADRCEATGDAAGAALARRAAADARRCLSVRDAIKIEEALSTSGTGGGELADRGGCLGFFKRGTVSSSPSSLPQSPIKGVNWAGAALATGVAAGAAYSVFGNTMRSGGSPAWRNHNPGMLPYDDFAISHGAIGMADGIAVFPDLATGQAALQAWMQLKRDQGQNDSGSDSSWGTDESYFRSTGIDRSSAYRSAGIPEDRPLSSLSDDEMSKITSAISNQSSVEGHVYDTTSSNSPSWVSEAVGSSANS
ncbi:MAG: hypothetical protein JSR82_16405 [Verrucomicrobia bacterium]|nr:hypothetical protein [Verrucomicrobiota bacterium]